MDQPAITQYIRETFAGVDVVVASRENGAPEIAWGDTFFIFDPDRNFEPKHRMPFATIVTKDYDEHDHASNLNRPGVFRLNIGVGKQTFDALFPAGAGAYDFTTLDQLLPHPVYGRQHWVCVLNPSTATFDNLRPLLVEAYQIAADRPSRPRPETVARRSGGL